MVNMGELFAYPRLKDVPMSRIQLTDEEIERFSLQAGDLIFARRSLVAEGAGKCSIVWEVKEPLTFESSIIRARPNKEIADSAFLYYLFNSPIGSYLLGTILRQVAVAGITGSDLVKLEIPLPPLPEQRAIAGILGSLDDKIELNYRMNQTLESMARAVFRHQFVESEEVKDWEVVSIEQVAERVAMGPFGSSIKVETFVEEGIPIISGKHLRSFMLQDTAYNFISLEHAERLRKANVQRGDVIFTHAGNVGNLAFIPEDSEYERYVVSQRQFYMRCNSELVTPTFITFYFQSPEGQHKLLANMSSVGVPSIAQPVSYLRSIELPIPPKPILDKFEKFVSPLLKKYRANEKESRTLGSLRDSLLPKLMRGEVRVKDVEKAI